MKYLNISLIFACLILLLAACDDNSNIFDDEAPTSAVENLNLVENMLASNVEYGNFIKAVTKAGLDNRLGNSGTYTILAPTNEAMTTYINSKNIYGDPNFSIDDIDGATLKSDFSYHIINGIRKSTDFEGFGYVETISDEGPEDNFLSFYYENIGSTTMINNAGNVSFNDTELSNGLIHSINTVLSPPNIMDMIEYNPEFEKIGQLLVENDIQDRLRTGTQTTFFAPCNDAFPKFFDEYASLNQDELDNYLEEGLLLHLISDTLIFSNEIEPGFLLTAADANLSFVFDSTANEIFIRDFAQRTSNFKQTDIFARNGILHSIDNILMKTEAP